MRCRVLLLQLAGNGRTAGRRAALRALDQPQVNSRPLPNAIDAVAAETGDCRLRQQQRSPRSPTSLPQEWQP